MSLGVSEYEAGLTLSEGVLILTGDWTIQNLRSLRVMLKKIRQKNDDIKSLDAHSLSQMDCAGAFFLQRLIASYEQQGSFTVSGLHDRYQRLVRFVKSQGDKIETVRPPYHFPNWFYQVGVLTVEKNKDVLSFFSFVGELFASFFYLFRHFYLFSFTNCLRIIYDVLCRSFLLVTVTSFAMGMVFSYQLGMEMQRFGVGMYSISAVGVAILRELGPFLAGIMTAARCATGYAAVIGIMKVNLEINALKTMGRDPMTTLIIPRIVAMLIGLPLLAVASDVAGIIGAMLMTHSSLGYSYQSFFELFGQMVSYHHYILGMIKVPFFALIIAGIGCYQGLNTPLSAEGIGKKTTVAAVQSIFLIILTDAFFSVIARASLGF